MKKRTLDNVKFFNLKTIVEEDGNLVPIESNIDVPFSIKRVFYVYGVKDQKNRGEHSHRKTEQILICLNGNVEIKNKKIKRSLKTTQIIKSLLHY